MDDRTTIDPTNDYPSPGLRHFEEMALKVIAWRRRYTLARTRDAIEIRFSDGGDEDAELVVLVTPEGLELRLYTIDWTHGSYGPAASSALWRRVTWKETADLSIHGHLDALRAAHKARLETCVHCGKGFIDSRMAGDACHGCATRVGGVVF